MGVIYIMLVVSLLIAILFLGLFLWASKSGQFDDDYTPSVRILFDDDVKNIDHKHGSTKV
jgi:cbb3-type cytochrome oxidase maturation protein